MANPNKRKGDSAEREALAWLKDNYGHFLVPNPGRIRAGTSQDAGDLNVLPDVAVQVKSYANVPAAIAQACDTVPDQARVLRRAWGVGMVKWPSARPGTVRWLACAKADLWPGGLTMASSTVTSLPDALDLVRSSRQAVMVSRAGVERIVAPFEVWLKTWLVLRDPTVEGGDHHVVA